MYRRALGVAGLLLLGGCAGLLDQLESNQVAVATLVSVPSQPNPMASGQTIPAVTEFALLFGQVDKSKIDLTGKKASSGAFTAIDGADVTLKFTASDGTAKQINMKTSGGGKCVMDSTTSALAYNATSDYVVTISYSGSSYQMTVRPAAKVSIKAFEQNQVLTNYNATNGFLVERDPEDGATNNPAFVTAGQFDQAGNATVAWTNAPQQPMDFLQFVLDDTPWRTDTVTIPASAFAHGDGYAVNLTAFAEGSAADGDGYSALFLSAFLGGVADTGALVVQ